MKKWYLSVLLVFVVALGSITASLILPSSLLSPNLANAQGVNIRNSYVWLTLPSTGNQDDSWSCGPNSAARILAFYGNQVDYGTVRSAAQRDHGIIPTKICVDLSLGLRLGFAKKCVDTSDFKTGLEPWEIRDVMNRWEGGKAKYEPGSDFSKLKNLLNQGKPVLVLLRVGSIQPGKIFGTWPEMHWVAVHGFNDQEQKVYYTDTNGGIYQESYGEFLSEWDWRIGDGLASETFYKKGIKPKTMVWIDRVPQIVATSYPHLVSPSVLVLQGNFASSGKLSATFYNLGNNRIQILVNDAVWFDSGTGGFNFGSTRGKCLTGLFSGSGRTDIACMYDYGNFNVGFVVFVSHGNSFSVSPWWTSGAGNMNPDMVGEIVAGDFAQTGATGLRFLYRYPEKTAYITMASNGSSFRVQKIDR